jgi:hypothetical protein
MLKECFQAFPASNYIVAPWPRAMVLASRLKEIGSGSPALRRATVAFQENQ